MYQFRDIVSQGTINGGTRGPRTFVRGHLISGRPVTPPMWLPKSAHKYIVLASAWYLLYNNCLLKIQKRIEPDGRRRSNIVPASTAVDAQLETPFMEVVRHIFDSIWELDFHGGFRIRFFKSIWYTVKKIYEIPWFSLTKPSWEWEWVHYSWPRRVW